MNKPTNGLDIAYRCLSFLIKFQVAEFDKEDSGPERVNQVKVVQRYAVDEVVAVGSSVTDLNLVLYAGVVFARSFSQLSSGASNDVCFLE